MTCAECDDSKILEAKIKSTGEAIFLRCRCAAGKRTSVDQLPVWTEEMSEYLEKMPAKDYPGRWAINLVSLPESHRLGSIMSVVEQWQSQKDRSIEFWNSDQGN